MTSDVAKRLGEGLCCKLKRRACLGIGGALREHFDEQDAERPDIAGGGERAGCGFRRVVGGALRSGFALFVGGEYAVGGEFHLIRGGQNI